jgi:hypothetical protein
LDVDISLLSILESLYKHLMAGKPENLLTFNINLICDPQTTESLSSLALLQLIQITKKRPVN